MKSESPDRLAWPCSQLEDLTQMMSVSQIVRLYRSDRPNTGKEGHNPAIKAKNAKKDRRAILCWPWFSLQGGKTFCASFCASLIAGSRRAFLCVDCVCLFGVLSEMHEVRTFAPCKAFLFDMFAFFCRLKITLDSEQPMLKEKRIIPSVWGGIKGFEHFLRGEYFSDCASD